jgi:hypothetical protein
MRSELNRVLVACDDEPQLQWRVARIARVHGELNGGVIGEIIRVGFTHDFRCMEVVVVAMSLFCKLEICLFKFIYTNCACFYVIVDKEILSKTANYTFYVKCKYCQLVHMHTYT